MSKPLHPKFLTINTRVSPTFVKELMAMLPKHVEVVGMPDFIGLAEESGAVVAKPYSDGVGAGESVKVLFQLHNASGQTGKPGKVTWKLPPGWTSSPAEWDHGPVPQGSNLKQVVTFTPPAGASPGNANIVYQDSRFRWKKDFSLTVYPKADTITDCDSTTGWTATNGALVAMDRDMIKIAPPSGRSRADYFEAGRAVAHSARATFPLKQIDFSRNPLLKITVPDVNGSGTVIGLLDEKGVWKKCGEASVGTTTINLAAVTKWKGTQDVTLTIDPVTLYGSYARIRNIKVCYP